MTKQMLLTLAVAGMFLAAAALAQAPASATKVLMKTTKGDITIELNAAKAPVTVKNFLSYVRDGFYNGTIFHRVIPGFMIQGGGLTAEFHEKSAKDPIKNESGNGLTNARGSIAMARTEDLNSATCQFYINLVDNFRLDELKYCVFGRVVSGMDVVDAIAKIKTGTRHGMEDVPSETVTILSVGILGGK
jgi:peptidyl-prolyl cis-trans isomerase A (cyclophilin A)